MVKKAQSGAAVKAKPAGKKKNYPLLGIETPTPGSINGQRGVPLSKQIQDDIKSGKINKDGTSKTPLKKGGSVKKMQMGGYAESNKFTIPSKNKISIPKKTSKDSSVESNVFTIPSRNKISIPKKGAMMKKGGTMKKCKYGCK
jgi:hypothetical protein